jgi:predicted dehydrogenase
MESIRVGVIGLGMGRHHIKGYQGHPAAQVVAVADPDEARLQEIGDAYSIPRRYHSAEKMLLEEKLDVASIATPNKYHKPLALAAFEAGCHVLCEKPMAMSAAEACEMLAAAETAGKRLMINFSYRFTEQSMALKRQMEAGAIGDVYFARTVWHRRRGLPGLGGWFGQKALSGGGPLIDLGVHRLDLALWLMGYPQPVWVMGSTYNPIGSALANEKNAAFDVEDLAVGLVKFANGATLELEASWAANIKEAEHMETRLYGTLGGLVQRNLDETYKFEAEMFVERNGAHFDMKLHPPVPPVPTPMAHFVESILCGTPHIATGEEGLLVMEILDALYQSAAEGRPVRVPETSRRSLQGQ